MIFSLPLGYYSSLSLSAWFIIISFEVYIHSGMHNISNSLAFLAFLLARTFIWELNQLMTGYSNTPSQSVITHIPGLERAHISSTHNMTRTDETEYTTACPVKMKIFTLRLSWGKFAI